MPRGRYRFQLHIVLNTGIIAIFIGFTYCQAKQAKTTTPPTDKRQWRRWRALVSDSWH